MKNLTDIRVAISGDELEEIYSFRYQIYVEEMNRKQIYADHRARRIEDPLDLDAINLGAWRGKALVGVVRINFPRDSDIGNYENFYRMRSVGEDHPSRTSIITRLMIAPKLRNTHLFLDLVAVCYAIGMARGIRWTFIDCNAHLVPLFLRLGYLAHTSPAVHEEYGLVSLLRIDLQNLKHLRQVKSPFAKMIEMRNSATRSSQPATLSLR